jgi:tetratricopeptide (TPR) repeat protein
MVVVLSALLVLAISTIRAWSIFNYSIWNVDEEQTVIHALGFLNYDFNPHWFGYHTLPMYVLSVMYFTAYYAMLLTGYVSSNIEFVSLVFAEHAYFFTPARLVFCGAHTLGCLTLAYVIARNYQSRTGAVAFLIIAFLLPESVSAANTIRVDTFVFLFMTLTIYFSCFATKNQTNFILSIVFCTAALASKIPAVIFFPILFTHQTYLIYKGVFPKYFLVYFLIVPLISILIFMPFMIIDYESYFQFLKSLVTISSGEHLHIGKVHHFDFISKIMAIYHLLKDQVGIVSIICSVALPVLVFIKKDKALVISSIYVFAFCGMFSTATFVDTYWLIPVYPYFVFFSIVLFIVIGRDLFQGRNRFRTKSEAQEKFLKTAVIAIFLLLYSLSVFGLKPKGVIHYLNIVTTSDRDTRIIAGDWIKDNLPKTSIIILDGFIQHYLPRVLSVRQQDSLNNSYFNIMGAIGRNEFLLKSFDYYYARQLQENSPFEAIAMDYTFRIRYVPDHMHLPVGAYVVISDRIYNRFHQERTKSIAPQVTRNALAFYDYVTSQKHIKKFSGYGPEIDIYQLVEPWGEFYLSNVEYQYESALALQQKGDVTASLPYLIRISTLERGYRNSLFLEGWAYQKLGRWPEAEQTYMAALEYDPLHVQTRFNLAYGLMDASRYREAISEFEEVIRINPGNGSAHHWLGKCYAAIGDNNAAEQHEAVFQETRK